MTEDQGETPEEIAQRCLRLLEDPTLDEPALEDSDLEIMCHALLADSQKLRMIEKVVGSYQADGIISGLATPEYRRGFKRGADSGALELRMKIESIIKDK